MPGRKLQPEQTAIWVAMQPTRFDDTPKPVMLHATPPCDQDIKLAFAAMLELADRLNQYAGTVVDVCDAPTDTGRAVQAALLTARSWQEGRPVGTPEVMAAKIVMGLVCPFLADKLPRPVNQVAQARRKFSTLLMLGGRSSHQVAAFLRSDHSAICRRFKSDLVAIEARFGHFCKHYRSLRRKWPLPQKAKSTCYTESTIDFASDTFGDGAEEFDAETLRLLAEIDDIVSAEL